MHSSSSIDTQDNFINGGLSGDLFTLDSEKTIYIRLKIDYMLNETPLDLLYHGYEVRIQKKQGNSYSTVYTIFIQTLMRAQLCHNGKIGITH